jgi:hypothetical protein
MNRKKSFEIPEKMQNRIVSVAYGDSSLLDRIKVMLAASRSDEVRDLLSSYKATASKVKELGEEEFPQELLKSAKLKNIARANRTNTFFYDLLSVVLVRPVFSAAVSFILIAAIITSLIINKPVKYKYNYTPGEIAAAEQQTKYALDVVGRIFKETHITLKKEILDKAVAKPFNQSAGIVNNLLKGDKNETN